MTRRGSKRPVCGGSGQKLPLHKYGLICRVTARRKGNNTMNKINCCLTEAQNTPLDRDAEYLVCTYGNVMTGEDKLVVKGDYLKVAMALTQLIEAISAKRGGDNPEKAFNDCLDLITDIHKKNVEFCAKKVLREKMARMGIGGFRNIGSN